MRRLKHLEAENARLKKLVAERDLEIEVISIGICGIAIQERLWSARVCELAWNNCACENVVAMMAED